jgi:hypothetical protein
MKCSSVINSMEDKIHQDDECDVDIFDAIVQVSKHYAFIFEMNNDFEFDENRDICGGEPPTERSEDIDGIGLKAPYLAHIDCSNCGEEIELSRSERQFVTDNNPLPCKKDLDYAIKCAEELELENWDYWN